MNLLKCVFVDFRANTSYQINYILVILILDLVNRKCGALEHLANEGKKGNTLWMVYSHSQTWSRPTLQRPGVDSDLMWEATRQGKV
jgi:hypothetical protein